MCHTTKEELSMGAAASKPGSKAARLISDEGVCSSHLHCSRPDAGSSSGPVCDILGLVGGTCSHGIPLLGLFMQMSTPEQFAFYLLLLLAFSINMAAHGFPAADVYIDFACRLKGRWQRFLAGRHPAVQQACSKLRLMVNWMHAAGHSWTCQLVNSGRFILGAAWRVGEQSEQLWSMLKVCVGVWVSLPCPALLFAAVSVTCAANDLSVPALPCSGHLVPCATWASGCAQTSYRRTCVSWLKTSKSAYWICWRPARRGWRRGSVSVIHCVLCYVHTC